VVTAVKDAFGYSGGIGVMPTDDPPLKSIIEQLEYMVLRNYDHTKISQNDTPGLDGPKMRVTKVREGLVFTLGGPSSFDEFSAEIKPGVKDQLAALATMLAGRRNKIILRGHAASKYLPADSNWADLDELSYQRARNVLDELVGLGLEDHVFRIEAVGTREPVRPRAVDPAEAAENRRVEVILSDQLVDEVNTDADFTSPDLARGGLTNG
jgi:chemotaxis protein MotB